MRHRRHRPRPQPPAPARAMLVAVLGLALLVGPSALVPATNQAAAKASPLAAQDAVASPAATPTATDLLARASKRLAETESVRFDLTVEGLTFLDSGGQIRLLEAEGNLLRPDRVRASFQAEVVGQVVTLELITVGETSWTTDLLTGEWNLAPPEFAYRPSILFDNQEGIGPVMGRVRDAQRLEDEDLDGRAVYRIRASVDEAVIRRLTYATMTGDPVTVDLWIDRETDELLRARLAEPADDPDQAIWTLDLSEHGDEVTIEPPV